MTTITILNEDIKLKNYTFTTFSDFIDEIEDYKFGQILDKNTGETFDISILEKKYLG